MPTASTKALKQKHVSHVPGQLFTLSMTTRERVSARSHGFRLIFNSQYYCEGMSMPCVKYDTAEHIFSAKNFLAYLNSGQQMQCQTRQELLPLLQDTNMPSVSIKFNY